jgi:hypothetical protein
MCVTIPCLKYVETRNVSGHVPSHMVLFDKTVSNGFVFCRLPSEKYSVLICISRN